MLSILIPVYQFDVRQFVFDLLDQGRQLGVSFEIRIYDDASPGTSHHVNRELSKEPEVIYKEQSINVGRSRIRNQLAQDAVFDFLLFLDGDSAVVRDDFIKRYIDSADRVSIIHGGTAYAATPPEQPEAYLRWYYGCQREVRIPPQRAVTPYHSFTSNNFFCSKALFLQIRFDESLKGYGHEDTLFGFALKQAAITIRYIDNPLQHIGLESANVFLQKTKEGVRNLRHLYELGKPVETRLLDIYIRLKQWHLTGFIGEIGKWLIPWMEKQLKSMNPKLWVLDLYKLVIICGEVDEA